MATFHRTQVADIRKDVQLHCMDAWISENGTQRSVFIPGTVPDIEVAKTIQLFCDACEPGATVVVASTGSIKCMKWPPA